MDAAQNNFRKLVFFLAIALLLTAPIPGLAQTFAVNTTSVTIGSSSCNDTQPVNVTSGSTTAIPFSVAVQYQPGDLNGNWLFVRSSTGKSTSTGTTFADTTGSTGETLTIGLNLGIGAASDTATVVLTPTNGATPINITVFYQQNTTCGGNTGSATNNFITISPGNVSLTTNQTGQQSQTLTLQNLTGSGISFTYTLQPAGQWLSAASNSNTISASGTTPVTITGDATKVSGTGTYTGSITFTTTQGSNQLGTTINIPVTFVVTSGSGTGTGTGSSGTLTVNGATSNTYGTTFSESGGSVPGGQCIPLQDTAAGVTQYSYQVATSSGGNWLLANFGFSGTTQGLISPSSAACVTLTLASNVATSLPSGIYQGSVALTSQSGSTASINVTLYVSGGTAPGISVSPGTIFTFPGVAAGTTTLAQQGFSLTALTGYNLGTAAQSSSSGCGNATWFSMTTPTASGNTESFTATVNPSGLVAGLYCTTVSMVSTGTQSGTTTILIILPVGQSGSTGTGTSGGGGTTQVVPSTLNFQQQSGSLFWQTLKESQNLTITGPSGTAWSASIIYGAQGSGWLGFDAPALGSGTFGSGPATLTVDLSYGVANLAPSATPYTATITITTSAGTSSVAVNLLVTATQAPVLIGLPSLVTFSAVSGSSPAAQTVQVVGSDNTASPTSPTITVGTPTASWISVQPSGNTMSVSVNPSGQATGVYYGSVAVSAGAYANPLVYPIVMVVNGGGGGSSSGPLSLSSSSLTYTNVTGQISQTLSVTANASTNTNVTATESSCTGQNWLAISPSGAQTIGTQSTPIAVTVNPAGISNGTTCIGTISLITSSATQTVNVSMTVGAAGGSGNVTVSPLTMTFTYTQQQTAPPAQAATIVNTGTGTTGIPFTVSVSPVNSWLQVNATSGTTPYNNPGLSVSVVPGSLGIGNYSGTVTIAPNGGVSQIISVYLTVNANAVVTATPTTLALSYQAGGTSPTGTIQVSGGGAAAGFTAAVTSGATWLAVTPTSGTTPNTGTTNLAVSLVPAALATLTPASSPYTGTITVAGTSPATGTTNINVTLTVTAALPAISGVTNSASGAVGAVSPGELISIFANAANPIGPSVGVALNSTTCPSPCTAVPTNMGGVQVKFLPIGIYAPLIYVSSGQINAVVPYQVAGVSNISVEVLYLGQTSNAFPLTTAVTAPGIFTANGTGTGQAAIAQYDNKGNYQGTNSASTPAKVGWILSVYMTGEGVVTPAATTGAVTVATSTPPYLPQPLYVPNVTIGGQPVTLGGYGDASGLVSGVLQVNAVVPSGAGTGPVALTVSLGGNSAQSLVTVYLQ